MPGAGGRRRRAGGGAGRAAFALAIITIFNAQTSNISRSVELSTGKRRENDSLILNLKILGLFNFGKIKRSV